MAMLRFRPVDPCDLRCAMMRMRVCKMYTDRLKDRIFFTTRHASEKITIGLPLKKTPQDRILI